MGNITEFAGNGKRRFKSVQDAFTAVQDWWFCVFAIVLNTQEREELGSGCLLLAACSWESGIGNWELGIRWSDCLQLTVCSWESGIELRSTTNDQPSTGLGF
jgi:hypothetical protein